MRVLILGGTAYVGVHMTRALLARGHEVVHFNRGRTGTPPAGVRTVHGDRTRGFDGLEGDRFDAVVDTSAYVPYAVELAARFFEPRTHRYLFISTVSVYDHSNNAIDEDSATLELAEGASRTQMEMPNYGALKALCERVVANAFRSRSTILRPGVIAGPLDPTDRFTYWCTRFARGGEVLAPGEPSRALQFADARDLAAFATHLLERDAGGVYNVLSPPGAITMVDLMRACARAAGFAGTVTWIPDERLLQREVAGWNELPLWLPPQWGESGFFNHSVRRALVAGMTVRSVYETARDTLAWAQTRPRDYVSRAGLAPSREAELLHSS